ncbi:sterol desaturase family protein [Streptomyces sp. NBC_01275]|uniref:sterol desaturase family protein n=1 Tax=Streptomyces sp. NBC_01275 TaxID=2903807 RepID=UPI00225BC137|nr:sterol desaturase family protein [Streptomyces sp. NBC_01275]MCX4763952.1 sterol desaturase family protein [Streptomyces sp. NBC_01275]
MISEISQRLHDPITYALPAIALIIIVEILVLRYDEDDTRRFDLRDTRASVLTGVGALVVSTVSRSISLLVYAWVYVEVAPFHLPENAWYTWVILFFGVDLTIYGYHRMTHRVRVMWAGHQVHHSSEYLNVAVAVRRKWAQWFEKLMWLPLPLLGVPPVLVFTMQSLHLLYGIFAHTEKIGKCPAFIEAVFVTPSHHRVHHGSDQIYLDKNYGSILIIWDRLFGTFQPELHRPTYGLTTPLSSNSVWHIQIHEFAKMFRDVRRAGSWRHRLGYVFGPPGWKPVATGTARGGGQTESSYEAPLPGGTR